MKLMCIAYLPPATSYKFSPHLSYRKNHAALNLTSIAGKGREYVSINPIISVVQGMDNNTSPKDELFVWNTDYLGWIIHSTANNFLNLRLRTCNPSTPPSGS